MQTLAAFARCCAASEFHRRAGEHFQGGGRSAVASLGAVLLTAAGLGCAGLDQGGSPDSALPSAPLKSADVLIQSPEGTPRPPFKFAPGDELLLDEVQRGAFRYLWLACDEQTGMVFDRSSSNVVSVAGVGFQLAALPVGVERAWVTREEARTRALRIIASLEASPRKAGLCYHFVEGRTAQLQANLPEGVVSTIDASILFAGLLTAGSYFGGDVRERADALFALADWRFFLNPEASQPEMRGFLSLGWKPESVADPSGPGALLPYFWADSGDEHRLVTFLAVAAPDPARRIDASTYYRLRRQVGKYEDSALFCYFPWSGALFTNFFAHCFIDYAGIGTDDPAAAGVPRRVRVDWWENSRRAVAMHRRKALENPRQFATLGPNAWGLSSCDAAGGYLVPGLFPDPVPLADALPELDLATFVAKDNWGDGTVAPYAAGCAVVFEPRAAVAALRHYRELVDAGGKPVVWRGCTPTKDQPGYGFLDSFNSDTGWVASDYVAIDVGPLVLSIENARTGLCWNLFHAHPFVRQGLGRLRLHREPRDRTGYGG